MNSRGRTRAPVRHVQPSRASSPASRSAAAPGQIWITRSSAVSGSLSLIATSVNPNSADLWITSTGVSARPRLSSTLMRSLMSLMLRCGIARRLARILARRLARSLAWPFHARHAVARRTLTTGPTPTWAWRLSVVHLWGSDHPPLVSPSCTRPVAHHATNAAPGEAGVEIYAHSMSEEARPVAGSVFASPGYRRLWAARTASQWGDTFNVVALVLLVFDLTGSGIGVSGVVIAEILPVLILAPIAGTVVDRLPHVRVMVAADVVRSALAAVLPLVDDNTWAVYAVAFGLSTGAVFFNPAAGALLPALVRREQLVAANSGIWTAAVLSQIALAPLAGVLVTLLGYGPAFLLNAASFAMSAVVLAGLRVSGPQRRAGGAGWWREAREGAAVIAGAPLLRALAGGQLLAALSAGATSALLVVLAREHLQLDAGGYGLLLAAIGSGAAAGPLLLLRLVTEP
jgi:MFS family permease